MVVATWVSMATFWLGWVRYDSWERTTEEGAGFLVLCWDWVRTTGQRVQRVWAWDEIKYLRCGGHTWTVMVEMAMSLLLFVVLLGVCRCRTTVRMAVLVGGIFYAFRGGYWGACEFLAGACIAELGSVQDE